MRILEHECNKCELIPCINFYRELGEGKGGEFFIYETLIKNKIHTPCEFGVLIFSLCKLSIPISEALSFELFHQCIRDMKAVSFLILTGHYRSAMQIMRPIIENWLAGLYWDVKYSVSDNTEKIETEYEKFRVADKYEVLEEDLIEAFGKEEFKNKNKKYLDQEFLLRWLQKKEVIDGKVKNYLGHKIGILNSYLHPNFKQTEISKPNCAACPSCVFLDEEVYKKSVEIFQDIATLLLDTFYHYLNTFLPEDEKNFDVEEALHLILALPEIEMDIIHQVIYSKELEEFIKLLKDDLAKS